MGEGGGEGGGDGVVMGVMGVMGALSDSVVLDTPCEHCQAGLGETCLVGQNPDGMTTYPLYTLLTLCLAGQNPDVLETTLWHDNLPFVYYTI